MQGQGKLGVGGLGCFRLLVDRCWLRIKPRNWSGQQAVFKTCVKEIM